MTPDIEQRLPEEVPTLVTPVTGRPTTLPRAAPAIRKGPGLGTRFFIAAALLLAAALGSAIAFASWRANQVAEKSIREALAKVPHMLAAYESEVAAQTQATVRSLADDSGTKALLDSDANAETFLEWASTKAKLLGARTVFLFDRQGALVTRSDRPAGADAGRPFHTVKWVAAPLQSGSDASAFIREGKELSLVVSSAVVKGDRALNEGHLNGVVAAAFVYDVARAEAIRSITGGQVAILADTARRGSPPHPVIAAATPGFPAVEVIASLDRRALATLFTQGEEIGPRDVPVVGDVRVIKAVPVKSASGEAIGAVVVARSRAEETAAFREIRRALTFIGIFALVVSLPVSLLMGHRIARPLEQLARGADAIRDGRLDVTLPEAGRDEVGALARAFRAMLVELKEKAALEEMLAAMRRPVRRGDGATAAGQLASSGSGPSIGQLFAGRYEILALLGRGGMGSVYRALDRELDEDVALKVINTARLSEGVEAVRILKQEIRLARRITHPNVVRTHDVGEAEGLRFLTMEFVPGTTLREVIDHKSPISLGPGLQISKQLCRGLGAVHEAGIVHRDIKPQNVMVLPNGVVKLMDFGIARTTGAEGAERDELAVGTPHYMSPEQAQGLEIDARSDIYSVGVLLFELFTGARPVEGKNAVDVLRAHISTPARNIRELRPDLPKLLAAVVMACLAKTPERRPPSADDLYRVLMRIEG